MRTDDDTQRPSEASEERTGDETAQEQQEPERAEDLEENEELVDQEPGSAAPGDSAA